MNNQDPTEHLFYDRYGTPISRERWSQLFFDEAAKTVAKDIVAAGDGDTSDCAMISTVWLGIDHSFGTGTPILFETMVFGGPNDSDCHRYSTEEEAQAGHREVLAQVRSVMFAEANKRMEE